MTQDPEFPNDEETIASLPDRDDDNLWDDDEYEVTDR